MSIFPKVAAEATDPRPADSHDTQRCTVKVQIYTHTLKRPSVTGEATAYVSDDGFWETDEMGGWSESLIRWWHAAPKADRPARRAALRRAILRAAEATDA